jgi:hypothetical protein
MGVVATSKHFVVLFLSPKELVPFLVFSIDLVFGGFLFLSLLFLFFQYD